MKQFKNKVLTLIVMCLFSMGIMAQKTFYDMERLTVNENVSS